MEDKAKLFESDSEFNALANAIVIAAEAKDFKDEDGKIYEYFDKQPKTSLVVFLVEALNEYGFKIVKASLHTQQDKSGWFNPALLPKESGEYLIMAGWYEEHQFRHISKFDADKSKWNTAYHVYAWQPLPTPPTK